MLRNFFYKFPNSKFDKFPKWPHFEKDEVDALKKVIKSGRVNYWTGSQGKIFEEQFAKFSNTKYGIAVSNGTLALDAAYRSMGFSEGDEIITTPRTFIATSSTASLLGLIPKFADVDEDSGNITAKTIEPLISKNTKFISVVHLGGWPADMNEICDLAKSYNLKVIEDCAQAHGATINGQSVGSFGDISAWSFCNDKIISTGGEGGMVTTNKEKYYEFMWSFKDHGKSKKLVESKSHPPGYKWLHNDFGLNYRITEMQSAIGILQLKKLGKWHNFRKRNAMVLYEKLKEIDIVRINLPKKNFSHAWYKFYCFIIPENLKSDWSRTRIIQEINKLGYPAFHGSCSEIYLEKCFKEIDKEPNGTPISKKLGETSLMFLVHPTINIQIMHRYAEAIYKVLKDARKS